MIKFYYTSITSDESPQARPDLSLGGFKSSTVVPPNLIGNLFGDISLYSVRENQTEYIALVAKNEPSVPINDVTFYFDYPKNLEGINISQKKIEIALVALTNGEMEFVQTLYSTPYLIEEWYDIEGVDNAINIGTIEPFGEIGIWFKKTLNLPNIETEFSDENLELNGTPQKSDELIDLVINYEVGTLP